MNGVQTAARSLRCPHFAAALAALAAVVVLLSGVEAFTRWRLPQKLNRFAEKMDSRKLLGNAEQVAAFAAPRVLPLYGSSELNNPVDNRAEEFFLARPEGLRVFPIGRPGNSCLLILEKIAAAGPAARGRKVAIFLSPNWFLRSMHTAQVEDNVTPTQLTAWLFGDTLSDGLKQRFARRLIDHREGLQSEPMLRVCLSCLASGTPADRCRFALLTPVGRLRAFLLARLDYWASFHDLLRRRAPRKPPVEPRWQRPSAPLADPAWDHLARKAEARDRRRGLETPYSASSIPGHEAKADRNYFQRHGANDCDAQFADRLARSDEWENLALLADALREIGADAVFISQPLNGIYHDLGGLSAAARRGYYDRLSEVIRPSGYPLLDFSDHEQDKYFFNDANHPSAKAWIYYDHAIDDFYHRRQTSSPPRI